MEDNISIKRHLKLLSKQYTNIGQVSEEIINLQAILNLPKGTELFLSDIHGEYGSFSHILNNGSGIIKSKIENIFRRKYKIKYYCLESEISIEIDKFFNFKEMR